MKKFRKFSEAIKPNRSPEQGREEAGNRFVSSAPKGVSKPAPQVASEEVESIEEVRKMANGGRDNAGGQHYDIDNGDGTIGFGYKPGKSQPSSSHSNYEYKPEPKHSLHGKLVTAKHSNGEEVTGRMMGTEHQGTVAKIKHSSGMIHSTDAKTVKKANSGMKEDIERVEEMDKSQTPPGRDGGYQFAPGPKVSKKDIEAVKKNPAKHLSDLFAKEYAKKKMKEAVEPPFTPNKPKTSSVAGKFGKGYSTARHLARMAMQKQVDKLKKPVKESMEESRKAEIVKDIVKKKKAASEDTFQKDPELSSSLTKTQ